MNIALLLEMATEAAPDRIALVCDGKRWSYAELLGTARGAYELIVGSGASHAALLDESSEAAVGENFSPGEIEDVLLTHPAIADVAAVAVPSPEWVEAVGVGAVLRGGCEQPSDGELSELVRARLRSSRVPETLRFLASLPFNEMGKLLRREVRTILAD